MDIAAKFVFFAQDAQSLDHELGGEIWVSNYSRAEEETFYVVASVETDGEIGQFAWLERGARAFVADAVDAIGAVIDAGIAEEHLEKCDTAPICREAMADARSRGVAKLALLCTAIDA